MVLSFFLSQWLWAKTIIKAKRVKDIKIEILRKSCFTKVWEEVFYASCIVFQGVPQLCSRLLYHTCVFWKHFSFAETSMFNALFSRLFCGSVDVMCFAPLFHVRVQRSCFKFLFKVHVQCSVQRTVSNLPGNRVQK